MARRSFGGRGHRRLEANISCPNVKVGADDFATDAKSVFQVVSRIREAIASFLMVKLSPNVPDIPKIAVAAEEAGADAVSLINTLTGMAIDLNTRTPILANVTGGLSGPAVKPIGLRMVWQVARAVHIPVVGIGGIATARMPSNTWSPARPPVRSGRHGSPTPCQPQDYRRDSSVPAGERSSRGPAADREFESPAVAIRSSAEFFRYRYRSRYGNRTRTRFRSRPRWPLRTYA